VLYQAKRAQRTPAFLASNGRLARLLRVPSPQGRRLVSKLPEESSWLTGNWSDAPLGHSASEVREHLAHLA